MSFLQILKVLFLCKNPFIKIYFNKNQKNYLFKTIFIIKFINLVFQLTTFFYKIKTKKTQQ